MSEIAFMHLVDQACSFLTPDGIRGDDAQGILWARSEITHLKVDRGQLKKRIEHLESLTRWYTLAEKAPPENVPVLVRRSGSPDYVTVSTRCFEGNPEDELSGWVWTALQYGCTNLLNDEDFEWDDDYDYDEWRYLIVPEGKGNE